MVMLWVLLLLVSNTPRLIYLIITGLLSIRSVFVEDDLLSWLQGPAAAVSAGALCAVPAALLGVRARRRGPVPVPHMGLREAVRVDHREIAPGTQDEMQVRGERTGLGQVRIDQLVPLSEAEDLAVRLAAGDLDHAGEIAGIGDVAGNMEPEEQGHHDGGLDLAPVCIGVGAQDVEVVLVGEPYRFADAGELMSIAPRIALTIGAAGGDGRELHAGEGPHLSIARTDLDCAHVLILSW